MRRGAPSVNGDYGGCALAGVVWDWGDGWWLCDERIETGERAFDGFRD